MKEINRSFQTTFVFSTHDKKVIAKADRLVRIEDGRVRRLGMRTADGWVLVKERRSVAEVAGGHLGGGRNSDSDPRCSGSSGGRVCILAGAAQLRRRRSAAAAVAPDVSQLRLAAAEPDPLSKDALFGTAGAAEEIGRREVQRLLRGLGAYTYADPDALVTRRSAG